jgi:transcriptional regulatory protein GAL4
VRQPLNEHSTSLASILIISRHLTEVEEKLERAERILRTVFPDQHVQQLLSHGLADGLSPLVQGPQNPLQTSAILSGQPRRESLSPGSADAEREGFDKPAPRSNVGLQPSHEFETVPFAADDDFEWDERESLWTLGDPGGRSTNFDLDAEIPKLTDGMATLTANDTNTGFLGSVSGASLLRLISSGSQGNSSQSSRIKQEQRDESMPDIMNANYNTGPSLRAQPLLTRQFVDGLINAYFSHYHPTFPILHEPTFREQYHNLGNRPKGTWHVLANLVAAMGSFVSSPCNDDTHITLFNVVKNSLSIESLEAGSLGLVQAFAMAANYLQKRNRPNSGYNYGGLALRLAISLGLHKEVHGWQTTPLKKEIRRRVWWSLCVLDVGATVTYGRPLNWPRVGVDTPFPLNIQESSLTAQSTSLPIEINEATYYTYVNTQSQYHLRTMRIYDRLISSPIPTADELIALDDDCIEGWRTSLPPYYCDEDLNLPAENLLGHSLGRFRYRVMRVVMYRPFLLRWAQHDFPPLEKSNSSSAPQRGTGANRFTEAENIATKRCLRAAEECISVLFRFWTKATHTRLAAWYVL